MPKVQIITTAQPSPRLLACLRCGTKTPFPLCEGCRQPYAAQKFRTITREQRAEARRSGAARVIEQAVGAQPTTPLVRVPEQAERIPRHQRRNELREAQRRKRKLRRNESSFTEFAATLTGERAGRFATMRDEPVGMDSVLRIWHRFGQEQAELYLDEQWARRGRRIEAYESATGLPFTDWLAIKKHEHDVELQRRQTEGR